MSSKLLVNQLLARAAAVIQAGEYRPDYEHERAEEIQGWFDNNKTPFGSAGYRSQVASLVEAITGFRPYTGPECKLFSVWKFNSETAFRICVSTRSGQCYGMSGPTGSKGYFDASCRLATPEEARKFLNEVVSKWTDDEVLIWISTQVGSTYMKEFTDALVDEHHC